MAKNKTAETKVSVQDFLQAAVDSEEKRADSTKLISLMEKVSGYPAKMWGPSIIGFGSYHYKYASGHEGDAPILGFSPRKSAFSLYVFTALEEHYPLLENLGKFKMGKACIYVKKLSDIDTHVLTKIMEQTIQYLKERYPD